MEWICKCWSKESQKIVDLDIVPYLGSTKNLVLRLSTKEEFSQRLWDILHRIFFDHPSKYKLYLSKSEKGYSIMPIEGSYGEQLSSRIYPEDQQFWEQVWDVSRSEGYDFDNFKYISICDQIAARWDDFVEYCWSHKSEYRLIPFYALEF